MKKIVIPIFIVIAAIVWCIVSCDIKIAVKADVKGWVGTNSAAASTNVVITNTVYVVQSGQSCIVTNLHPSGPTNYQFFTSGTLVSNVTR